MISSPERRYFRATDFFHAFFDYAGYAGRATLLAAAALFSRFNNNK